MLQCCWVLALVLGPSSLVHSFARVLLPLGLGVLVVLGWLTRRQPWVISPEKILEKNSFLFVDNGGTVAITATTLMGHVAYCSCSSVLAFASRP